MASDQRPSPGATAAGSSGALVKVRLYLVLLVVFLCLASGVSLTLSLRGAAQEYETLALFTARSFFQQVAVTRRWNALHGGVYVPVTDSTRPNPYLEDPRRDVVTTDGLRLTKLNHAHMIRLISDVLKKEHGMQLHLTSLKPIRPENAPDSWEREALQFFERGGKESVAVNGAGDAAVFRYIAPLKTEAACLECHARQQYKPNDICGGVGVTFPYQPFSEALAQHRRTTTILHLSFFGFSLGFILILGHLLLQRVRDLQEFASHIRKLEGLLPICAGCKKIRVAGGDSKVQASWEPIESYIHDRTDAEFTHGLCPECARLYFGDSARP